MTQYLCWSCGLRYGEPDDPEEPSKLCPNCLDGLYIPEIPAEGPHDPRCACDRCTFGYDLASAEDY